MFTKPNLMRKKLVVAVLLSLIASIFTSVSPAKADGPTLTVTTTSSFYNSVEEFGYGVALDSSHFGWVYAGLAEGDNVSLDPSNWVVEAEGSTTCGPSYSDGWSTTWPFNVGEYQIRVRPLLITGPEGQDVTSNYNIEYQTFNIEIVERNMVVTSSNGGVFQYQTSSPSANLAPAAYTSLNWNYYGATISYLFSTDPATEWTSTAPTAVGNYLYRPVVTLPGDQLPCNYEITDGRLNDNEHPVIASWYVYANPVLPVLPPGPGVAPVAPTTPAPPAPDIRPTLDLVGGTYTYDGKEHAASFTVTPSDAKVTLTYSGLGGTPVNSGYYRVTGTATFGKYSVTQYAVIAINKAIPELTWNKPATITNQTALTTGNALFPKANVPGFFTYSPAAGTYLPAGKDRPLTAIFTPTDRNNYAQASIDTSIDVTAAPVNIAVSFNLNSFALSAQAIAAIEKAASQDGVINIVVYGYVQPSNNLTADNKLSLQRATAVASQIKNLIPGANVSIRAMGRTLSDETVCVAANNKCAVVKVG
jgi:MBG domain